MNFDTDGKANGGFNWGFEPDGMGPDGLPLYREVVQLTIARPPLLELTRVATEEDFVIWRDEYEYFQRMTKKRREPREGFPLTMWAAIEPFELQMCHARDIFTVEELARFAKSKSPTVPRQITEVARRAATMVTLAQDYGKHEAKLSEQAAEIEALKETLKEAHEMISQQSSMISRLQIRPHVEAA